jgi:type II restriction enzyme
MTQHYPVEVCRVRTSHALWTIITNYKSDQESVFNTWFINNEERLKAFRSIRRGVQNVIQDIKDNSFGNDYKGSSLEFVLTCITEQKQIFVGASHPFYWKPKLRIPDIYEHEKNKTAFGQFLENCLNATREEQITKEIILLEQRNIKGLGPAVANILYFLHPTIIPPFNTAIVNGFNYLFKDKVKLGSWKEYLRMREVIMQTNKEYKGDLSPDLGAFAGLLFDIGMRKILIGDEGVLSENEKTKIENLLKKRHKEVVSEKEEENSHTEMQYHLLKIGSSLGYDVISASNDRSRCHQGNNFSFISLPKLPDIGVGKETTNTISLIDVMWFEKGTNKIVGAFEVEKSTSIYSGILRLTDLYYSFPEDPSALFIIIPDNREKELTLQLTRPAIKGNNVEVHYILFSDLRKHCDAICTFGESKETLKKIAKVVR